MNIQRLHRLIQIMEKVRDEKRPLYMGAWVMRQYDDWGGLRPIPSLATPPEECGTASCALGWAARDHEFIKEGLSLSGVAPHYIGPYHDYYGYTAGAKFFGITMDQSLHLFSPDAYGVEISPSDITPDMVIEHIREVMRDGK